MRFTEHVGPWQMALTCLALVAPCRSGGAAGPPERTVAFLVAESSVEKLGPEDHAAWQLAQEIASASLVVAAGGGQFVDRQGQPVALDAFDVAWYHQGDSIEQSGSVYDPRSLEALRAYVAGGHGLFLSGAALGMVHVLRVEPVSPRRGGPGNDANPAALVPLVPQHPIFRDILAAGTPGQNTGRPIDLSDRGFPAFADFHALGGPVGGMLLGRSPGGSENPLVEYELEKGRIVAMGWRLPHYSHAANRYRANLESLTTNILRYLGDSPNWQKVVLGPVPGPPRPKVELGIGPALWESLDLAVRDLMETYPDRYPNGREYLARLAELKTSHDAILPPDGATAADQRPPLDIDALGRLNEVVEQFHRLQAEALLANPLVDFDRLLLVKRGAHNLGLPTNYQSNSSLSTTGYVNELAVLSPVGPDGTLTTLYEPEGGRFVGDVDLHFDADRMLFSMPGENGRWQIFEMNADGSNLHELPLIHEPDVDNYDACYLPDGRIVFSSTAPFVGVPCVRGGSHVTNLYLWDSKGAVRQLTVDQEHNWCPTVLNNGRVLYLRWEYTDTPHAFYRILFHMNPDGTEQMEYYGSNSYWPNAMFFARPVPGHPTKVVAVVGGHHAPGRTGELVIFDPARGRFEADGAVQRIPGRGQAVEPILLDGLASQSWPKFLHPYPLGEKHFLVACQPNQHSMWGIYLVDVFDNMVRLCEQPGYAMLEPIPLRKTPKPPTLPDKVDPRRDDAVVFMADVYSGGGLKGVPRGTVKALRLISYHFSYQGMGGQVDRVGLDGPWDVKQIVGTVPVEEDGSARFRVPACTPIAVQPLDAEGKAIQLMRSWFTAMPGEVLSCVGCHEHQNTSPPVRTALAATRPPSEIEPWYGPARGFGFRREVQPVLDKHCVGCHDSKPRPDGRTLANLTDRPDVNVEAASEGYNQAAHFSPSYLELRKFVRSPTIESDLHLLAPREFHADTTKLVQMLRKGHAGVQLDDEAWDRLITWIDLHTPFHGTWTEVCGAARVENQHRRRREMRKLYTGRDDDPEAVAPPVAVAVDPVAPSLEPASAAVVTERPGWPFGLEEARRRQQGDGSGPVTVAVELPDGISLDLVRIPAGEFVMGDPDGAADEGPTCPVTIDRPFWMSPCEITNAQYARFDPTHDSRLETGDFLQFDHRERGYPVNEPRQPVVRVSWNEATAFCGWLSEKTGRRFTLPSEAQWEYACRAGTATPLWYGTLDDDFSTVGNLSDVSNHAVDTFGWALPSGAVPPWRPADCRFDDGFRVSAPVGRFGPNPWGLSDMHGNVAEWTRSAYRPYPYHAADGREAMGAEERMVVRGGSWYDRPKRCRSAFRLAYPPDQLVFDVGFRVICEVLDGGRSAAENERPKGKKDGLDDAHRLSLPQSPNGQSCGDASV